MAINVSVSSTKSSFEYANDLQSAMSSNPLKKSETSAEDRNKNIQEAASKVDAKSLMTGYVVQFQMSITISSETNFSSQNGLFGLNTSAMNDPFKLNDILNGLDLKSIGYEGKPIQELSQDEAKALIAEDGFFGVTKTSDRIADFVLAGAGDDVEKLKAGREGILRGYNQAEKAWGGNLPDISKETLEINLAEGVMDTLSACYNLNHNISNAMNIAVCGKHYNNIIYKLIGLGLIGKNININIFSDNDEVFNKKSQAPTDINYFKNILKHSKNLFGDINVYYNIIGKDIGVHKKDISLKKYRV